jgi:glycerate dehydrogenase
MNTRIIALEADTLHRDHDVSLDALKALGELTLYPATAQEWVGDRMAPAEILVINKSRIGGHELRVAPHLKLIAVTATGTDNIDFDACREHGVAVCHVAGYSTNSVVQMTIGLMINLASQIPAYAGSRKAWSESPHFTHLGWPMAELFGKTLGIIGFGAIGRRVAQAAHALGMKIARLSRPESPDIDGVEGWPEEKFFSSCDVISLHCPLTEGTRHIVNERTLGLMKPGAFLINTARGALVEDEALVEALESGRLGGAALDVLSVEPPPEDHVLFRCESPRLLLTPHVAWATKESRARLVAETVANIEAFQRGESRNRVL